MESATTDQTPRFFGGAKYLILANVLTFAAQILMHSWIIKSIGLSQYSHVLVVQSIYIITVAQVLEAVSIAWIRLGGEAYSEKTNEWREILNTGLSFNHLVILLFSAVAVFLWGIGFEYHAIPIGTGLCIFSLVAFFESIIYLSQSSLMIRSRFSQAALLRTVYTFVRFGLIIGAIQLSSTVIALFWGYAAASLFGAVISLKISGYRIRPAFFSATRFAVMKLYLFQTWIVLFFKQVSQRSYDILMVSHYAKPDITRFRIGSLIGRSLNLLCDPISHVILSLGSREAGQTIHPAQEEAITETPFNLGSVIVPLAVVASMVLYPLMELLFPDFGVNGIRTAHLMLWLAVFDGVIMPAGAILRINRNDLLAVVILIQMVCVVAFGIITIPRYPYIYMVWGYVIISASGGAVAFFTAMTTVKGCHTFNRYLRMILFLIAILGVAYSTVLREPVLSLCGMFIWVMVFRRRIMEMTRLFLKMVKSL